MTRTVLIVEARFYPDISEELVRGAQRVLEDHEVKMEHIIVPGAFEIPGAIAMANESERYDGYVALGCVVRGETSHYDYVCGESARGLNELAIRKRLAIGYGILTVENKDQALRRARETEGNKGASAAFACLSMMQLRHKFGLEDANSAGLPDHAVQG